MQLLPVKPFRQNTGFCGPASLKMVLDYFGIEKTERELAKLCGATPKSGIMRGDQIVRAAEELGLKASIKDFSSLKDIRVLIRKKIPVIVNWFSGTEGHYSVVIGIDRENIYLKDPEWGHTRALRLSEFLGAWFSIRGNVPKTRDDFRIRRMIVVQPHKGGVR